MLILCILSYHIIIALLCFALLCFGYSGCSAACSLSEGHASNNYHIFLTLANIIMIITTLPYVSYLSVLEGNRSLCPTPRDDHVQGAWIVSTTSNSCLDTRGATAPDPLIRKTKITSPTLPTIHIDTLYHPSSNLILLRYHTYLT